MLSSFDDISTYDDLSRKCSGKTERPEGKERGQKKAWDVHMDSIQRRTRTLQDLLQWGTSLLLTYAKEFGLYPESSTEPWKHWNTRVTGPDLHIRAQFPQVFNINNTEWTLSVITILPLMLWEKTEQKGMNFQNFLARSCFKHEQKGFREFVFPV